MDVKLFLNIILKVIKKRTCNKREYHKVVDKNTIYDKNYM